MPLEHHTEHPLVKKISDALAEELCRLKAGITEFELIGLLQSDEYKLLDKNALRDSLSLFQTHFILFHCLYLLKDKLHTSGHGELLISATQIKLVAQSASGIDITDADPLRDYYLEWSHFSKTSTSDVDDLLDSFWRTMNTERQASEQEVAEALCIMNFSPDSTPTRLQIKRRYKALQHKYHPDKGGSVTRSQSLTDAYQILMVRN